MDCTPQGLATAAQCFDQCIPSGLHAAAQTMILAQIRAQLIPGASVDPTVIANEARCFDCGYSNYGAMMVFLECAIANASGA